MKVCLINNLYPPDGGGAEQMVKGEAERLVALGHEVIVITTTILPEGTPHNGVKIYTIPHGNLCHYTELPRHGFLFRVCWHIRNLWNRTTAIHVRLILEKELPRTVHTNNLMGIGFLIPPLIRSLGMAHMHTIHDVQLVEPSGILPWNHEKDTVFQKLYSALMRWRFRRVQSVVFPSQFLCDWYVKRKFFSKAEKETVSKPDFVKLGVLDKKKKPGTPITFAFVGVLAQHKGIDVLLAAWEQLRGIEGIKLLIAGQGPLAAHVEDAEKKDPRIVYLGQVPRDTLHGVYSVSEIFVFPSICIENRPTVLEEALAYGCFIIASKTGGVPELVTWETGVLLEPGNVEKLAEEMKKQIVKEKKKREDKRGTSI